MERLSNRIGAMAYAMAYRNLNTLQWSLWAPLKRVGIHKVKKRCFVIRSDLDEDAPEHRTAQVHDPPLCFEMKFVSFQRSCTLHVKTGCTLAKIIDASPQNQRVQKNHKKKKSVVFTVFMCFTVFY